MTSTSCAGPLINVCATNFALPGHRVCFYGGIPGVPCSNDEALVVLHQSPPQAYHAGAASLGGDQPTKCQLLKFAYEQAELQPVPSNLVARAIAGRGAVDSGQATVTEGLCGLMGSLAVSDVGPVKRREIRQATGAAMSLAVTGARGVACVFCPANQLIVLDLEEDENEDGYEDADKDLDIEGSGSAEPPS
jgi:hypothetical protein